MKEGRKEESKEGWKKEKNTKQTIILCELWQKDKVRVTTTNR